MSSADTGTLLNYFVMEISSVMCISRGVAGIIPGDSGEAAVMGNCFLLY